MRKILFIQCIFGLFFMAGVLHAQLLYELVSPNEEYNGRFGGAISGAGDVNNDGYDDIIVGARGEDPGSSPENAGIAYVFDGASGEILFSVSSPNEEADGYFGISVSGAGDANNDGHADVIVGAPYEDPGSSPYKAGRAHVFSGQTGEILFSLASPVEQSRGYFGSRAADAGDVNADGFDDVIIGAHGEDSSVGLEDAGHAYVFSGASGDLLFALSSSDPETEGYFGQAVAGAGDVNGDGYDDVVVGAWGEDPGTAPYEAGRAYVFSGTNGDLLFRLASPREQEMSHFGCSVSGTGDVDNDGYDDIIIGANGEGPTGQPSFCGHAYVLSGATQAVLHVLESPNVQMSGNFGYSVSGAGDVNNDGHADLIVGTYGENPDDSPSFAGRAYVFCGATGDVLIDIESPNEEEWGVFGHSVSGAGDANGDGFADVVVGADGEDPGSSPNYAGRAYVFSGFLIPVELTGFTASVENGAVVLTWATLSEHENFGFHVYRSRESAGEYMRITETIIPGAGNSSVRHDYGYSDGEAPTGTICFYKLADIDFQGHETLHGPVSVRVLPSEFTLLGASPNPFNETTTLRLNLSAKSHVCLRIYNLAGELVRTLADEEMKAGVHEIMWDGEDDSGRYIPPGVYTYRAQSDGVNRSGKLILIRG